MVALGCAGCTGAQLEGASSGVDQLQCPPPVTMSPAPSAAPSVRVSHLGDDVESRVRRVAEKDLSCSEQQVYVRRVYSMGDAEMGGAFEFYGAERCGLYQVYRASKKQRTPEPEGVDVFLVSPVSQGTLRIGSTPSYNARPPSRGERLLLLNKRGVVCEASVGSVVSNNVWAVEGCSSEAPIPFGVVAVRASDATKVARLELHWVNEPPPAKGTESIWRPFTVVDLTGDRRKEVAVFCRRSATSEYECERSMVYRGDESEVGWFVPVARAHWAPDPY